MADYTYTEPTGGVYSDPVSEIRFLLNDTTPNAPFSLSDAELQYLLMQAKGSIYQAAARGARRMATAYSKQSLKQKSVGNLSLSYDYSATAKEYIALQADLAAADGDSAPGGPLWVDAGCGPFYEGQFDNRYGGGITEPYDSFGNPNVWPI